jgi:FixJ family two-component response regulator
MSVMNLGPIQMEFGQEEEALSVLRGLLRHVNNKEVAHLLGISERTVRRWKLSGRLPNREHEQVSLLELVSHLLQTEVRPPAALMGSLVAREP